MKKAIVMLLIGAMSLSVAACGNTTQNTDSSTENAGGASSNAEATVSEEPSSDAITSIDDIAGHTVGVQLGTTGDIFAEDYAAENPGTNVDQYSKGADAVQALITGKVDCVIIDENPAKAFVAKNEGLTILDEAFVEEEYAICLAKDNAAVEDMNAALAELKEEGIVDQIIDAYIGDDTENAVHYESPADADHSNGTLVMATNAAFEPYEYYDDNGDFAGIDVELATAICDKLGYSLEISDMEFDSIIAAVQSGKADFGMAGMTVTEERLQSVNFTDTYTTTRQVIIVKN